MGLKTKEQNPARDSFWADSIMGDPLWEEWVLEQDVLDLLDQAAMNSGQAITNEPQTSSGDASARPPKELWVVLSDEPVEETWPLLLKIAASIGFEKQDLRFQVNSPDLESSWKEVRSGSVWFSRKVLFLGIVMPTLAPGDRPLWASAPDLSMLQKDENARKLLWNHIKGWKNA